MYSEHMQEDLVKKYDVLHRINKILSANTSNKNKEDQNKLLQSVTGFIAALVAGNGKHIISSILKYNVLI